MSQRRVMRADLAVGNPLPWNVYDGSGKLLLGKGQTIENSGQLERLVGEGLFVKEADLASSASQREVLQAKSHPSALKSLLDARDQVALIARRYKTEDFDFLARIEQCIALVHQACDINQDVAVAAILMRQDGSYAARHQVDVAVISLLVARALNLPAAECRSIVAAALTMNLSMLDVQDKLDLLQGELVPAMRNALLDHPRKSVELLRALGVSDETWLDCVAQHHERADGSGYPAGLASYEITTGAKIIALADRYCARICRHGNRPWRLPSVAMGEIFNDRGKYQDAGLTGHFVKTLGIYPAGTMVRLAEGEIGIVTNSLGRAASPMVHAVIGLRGTPLSAPMPRNPSRPGHAIHEAVDPGKVNLRIQMFNLWGKDASETGLG
jgi:HD-GYP domain-containing protein (c-di-GMP phosphodiesterase class II)